MQRKGKITNLKTLLCLVFFAYVLVFRVSLQAKSVHVTQYTVADGLASSIVYGCFEDRKGYMWFATEFGVSRYDGYQFVNYTTDDGLTDNVIFDFFEDTKGRLWFYTYNGIPCYYFDGKIYDLNHHPSLQNEAKREMVSLIFEDRDSTVWVCRKMSPIIEVSSKDSIQLHSILKEVGRDFLVSCMGQWWDQDSIPYMMSGSVIVKFDEASRKWIPFLQHQKNLAAPIFAAPMDYGVLLGRTESLIALYHDEEGFHIDSLCNTPNLSKTTAMVRIGKDDYMVGTYKGIHRYKDGKWDISLLEDYSVTSACKDREGNFWFTTMANGVFYAPNIDFLHWDQNDGFSTNGINKILVDKEENTLWLGMIDNSIASFQNGRIESTPIYVADGRGSPGTVAMAWDHDEIIMGFVRGITRFDPETKQQVHNIIPGSLKDMLRTPDGRILVCASIGVFFIEGPVIDLINSIEGDFDQMGGLAYSDQFQQYIIDLSRAYSVMQVQPGNLLLGTSHGLRQLKNGLPRVLFPDHPAMDYTIYSMAMGPDGTIWVATHGGGVLHIKADGIAHLDSRNGLNSNLSKSITVEKDGTAWVGSNAGVCRIRQDPNDSASYQLDNFSKLDGLSSNEINDLLVHHDTLWMASPEGLSSIPLQQIDRQSPPPFIYLDSLVVNNRAVSIQEDLELQPSENNLTVHFVGLSYQSRGQLQYHYRLLGADATWKTTSTTEVEFLALGPGDYTFELYATNFKEVPSETMIRLPFTILRPWWQRWWAIGLGLLLIVLTIYLFFQRRYKILKIQNQLEQEAARSEQKALRARIAPHFIYNALNSIQSLISDNERIGALNYTARFSRLMRKIFEQSLESFISLDEEMETLDLYLKLEQLRFQDKFSYTFVLDPELESAHLAIPSMILQPIIENSIWHGLLHQAKPGEISVRFVQEGKILKCFVQDNGVGREAARKFRSKYTEQKQDSGLVVTQGRLQTLARLEDLKSELKFEITDLYDASGNASGTLVEIWLPLKNLN